MKKLLLLTVLLLGLQTISAQNKDNGVNPATQDIKTEKVKVFPNPATNVVNVLGLSNSLKADIIVSDIYGNIVLQHQWQIKNQALNLPISNLEPGIYMISIRSQEQHIKTKFYKN
ncbi:T9SS type A sorting domain-containing protein [Maribacter algicola]|uniref:T9SS type A sorting domain-containing protein n=1 Tax=Meishania litoralis TaxID=3434685 RepID=A0ACC7LFN1_9FLAO